MTSPSPALLQKIKKARASAPADLPLVRSCAQVVLIWAFNERGFDGAVLQLKADHGARWSLTTALQLLSGRRGEFAAEVGTPEERQTLYLAHLVAKAVCSDAGLGAVCRPKEADLIELRRLSASANMQTVPSSASGLPSIL